MKAISYGIIQKQEGFCVRSSGILYPIFSLSSKYGIGSLSKEAYEFIDFLKEAGQSYWQILPVGPTGYGDSPYQPVSSFAINPYFIDLDELIDLGLISKEEVESFDYGADCQHIDYGALYHARWEILKEAYVRFEGDEDYQVFLKEQEHWLKDYALYMTLKQYFDGKSWMDWPEEYRTRDPKAIEAFVKEKAHYLDFYCFQQYFLDKQWKKLHAYAKKQGIQIIGDIPFYCAMDSCDTWAQSKLLLIDEEGTPEYIAGCLPDAFSATGQLWGNPLYDWDKMKKDHYQWWMDRMGRAHELFDVVRVDHFHGFAEYCAIPYGDETAVNGILRKGPGLDFFKELKKRYPDIQVIAEDLGNNTPEKAQLLEDAGYPGMNVLQFAFTGWDHDSIYLTHKHKKNSVVYTGTHDNPTTLEWFESLSNEEKKFVGDYIHSDIFNPGQFVWDFIREAYRSCADLCIVPLQDYLVKGKEARINRPGSTGSNWQWRLEPRFLSSELANSIHNFTEIYGRLPKESE